MKLSKLRNLVREEVQTFIGEQKMHDPQVLQMVEFIKDFWRKKGQKPGLYLALNKRFNHPDIDDMKLAIKYARKEVGARESTVVGQIRVPGGPEGSSVAPAPIRTILSRLKFTVTEPGSEHGDPDTWESRDKRITVNVFSNGQWVISKEELRKKGSGHQKLLAALKGFMESAATTSEAKAYVLSDWDKRAIGKKVEVSTGFFHKGKSYSPGQTGKVEDMRLKAHNKTLAKIRMDGSGRSVWLQAVNFRVKE